MICSYILTQLEQDSRLKAPERLCLKRLLLFFPDRNGRIEVLASIPPSSFSSSVKSMYEASLGRNTAGNVLYFREPQDGAMRSTESLMVNSRAIAVVLSLGVVGNGAWTSGETSLSRSETQGTWATGMGIAIDGHGRLCLE